MKENICLALGFFDSVHYGHRVIINKLKAKALFLGCKAVISTFSDSFCNRTNLSDSDSFSEKAALSKSGNLNKGIDLSDSDSSLSKRIDLSDSDFCQKQDLSHKLVYIFAERKRIFSELGIDDILLFDFDDDFKNQSPTNFLCALEQKYNLRYVVCGYDYRFGHGGEGNAATLMEFCRKNRIDAETVDKVCVDGERVSSSGIKELLAVGDIDKANKFLSDRYFIYSPVISGRGQGRLNNIPTANMEINDCKLIPKSGVYATKTWIKGRLWDSVTNVGAKPSYGDFSVSVETFIDGFDGDIYGEDIKVIFYKFLRETRKFADKEALAKQIGCDLRQSKACSNS